MKLFEYGRSRSELDLLKSIDIETLKASGVDMDDIEKAMGRDGMTQKEVQVTKDGKTFTRMQWVQTGSHGKQAPSVGHTYFKAAQDKETGGHIYTSREHNRGDEKPAPEDLKEAHRIKGELEKQGHKASVHNVDEWVHVVAHPKEKGSDDKEAPSNNKKVGSDSKK